MAAPIVPPERFPQRLASLDFVPHRDTSGIEYITPPLCTVPAGPFLMGSDPKKDGQAFSDEQPQHRVTLPAYQIAAYPVTVAEYTCAVRAGAVPEPRYWYDPLTELDHPVVRVSWLDAVAYASWLAKMTGQPWRLPTEAEWEKAARSIDGRLYPWGDQWDKTRANTGDDMPRGPVTTTAIGTYAWRGDASPYGVHDLTGNVAEWTSSALWPYPYTPKDGRENLDARGWEYRRTLRGGGWGLSSRNARAASRDCLDPDEVNTAIGFRLAVGG